ncbi:MAG: hypothetical protein WC381_11025 [Kiritimatiellia bacterium]
MKTNICHIITFCCIANVLVSSTGCKFFSRNSTSLASQTEKVQSTIIDNYLVHDVSITEAFAILSNRCGEKSGRSFSVIVKTLPDEYKKDEYKEPLVTLNCSSVNVRDIIKLISEQCNVFVEFTPQGLEVDCSRNSQGEKRK